MRRALAAAGLVLGAGVLLLISVPVTAFTRNPAATDAQRTTVTHRRDRPVTFRAGTFVCRQGERADHVLMIKSGWTRVFTEHMEGLGSWRKGGRATWSESER